MARRRRRLPPPPPANGGYTFEVIELGPPVYHYTPPVPVARGHLIPVGDSEGPAPPPRELPRRVKLDVDVAAAFPDDAAVNAALREYLRGRPAAPPPS